MHTSGAITPNKYCSNDRLCKLGKHNLRLTEMGKTLMVGVTLVSAEVSAYRTVWEQTPPENFEI